MVSYTIVFYGGFMGTVLGNKQTRGRVVVFSFNYVVNTKDCMLLAECWSVFV